MNRDIADLREVVTKLVPMIAGKGLRVTQVGSMAYVRANAKTNKPELVNIPSIPDNASSEFIAAIRGFIDHEVGHVLHTDWKYYGGDGVRVDKFSPEGRALTNTHNIVEDTFVEREMIKMFPGSSMNLDQLHEHFINRITRKALEEVSGDNKKEFGVIFVPFIRALAGQRPFIEFMDEGHWKHPMIENIHKALSDEALDLIKNAHTTQETLQAAQEIHDILFNQPPEKPEQPAPPSPPPPPSSKQPPEADDSGESGNDEGESQDKPEKPAEEGDGDGERDHSESEAEEGEDEGGPGEADEDGESDESAEAESSGDEGEADEGEAEDGEAEDGEADAEDGDGSPEDENTEDGETAGDGEGDSEKPESDGVGTASGEGESADEENNGEQGDDPENADDSGFGGSASTSMFDLDASEFEPIDLSEAISKEITSVVESALEGSSYSVFTREDDKVAVFDPDTLGLKVRDNWVPDMEEEVRSMVGRMQKDIERMMAAQSLAIRTPGHTRGKLHGPSLYRVMQNDPRVFTQREEMRTKDTAVTLLIDNSGSMAGMELQIAMKAAYALASTLERVNIPNEVMGFTTGDLSGESWDAYRKDPLANEFSRLCAIIMPIFKEFGERINPTVKRRFATQLNMQVGCNTNVDGESLEYAAMRLLPRPEKRKVMLVMSDGRPVGTGTSQHLKETVNNLGRMGIETVGIGINTDVVRRFYPRSIVLRSVSELPETVMGELRRILS